MGREFDAYNENFIAETANKDGRFGWMVRLYSYKPEPGFLGSWKGDAATKEEAKAAAIAEVKKQLEKYRRPPE